MVLAKAVYSWCWTKMGPYAAMLCCARGRDHRRKNSFMYGICCTHKRQSYSGNKNFLFLLMLPFSAIVHKNIPQKFDEILSKYKFFEIKCSFLNQVEKNWYYRTIWCLLLLRRSLCSKIFVDDKKKKTRRINAFIRSGVIEKKFFPLNSPSSKLSEIFLELFFPLLTDRTKFVLHSIIVWLKIFECEKN